MLLAADRRVGVASEQSQSSWSPITIVSGRFTLTGRCSSHSPLSPWVPGGGVSDVSGCAARVVGASSSCGVAVPFMVRVLWLVPAL